MERADVCNSCGMRLVGKGCASFPCPSCTEIIIGRCSKCRDQSVKYICHGCGFQGP